MCLRTRKFSKTDGDIPKLCRGWHNRLLLATFFFQEWCKRVNGKIIKSCLSLLPITKCNIDLDRNISGSFKPCWGIRYSHDLKVVFPPQFYLLITQGKGCLHKGDIWWTSCPQMMKFSITIIRRQDMCPLMRRKVTYTPSRKCTHQLAIYSYHDRITRKNLRRNPGCGHSKRQLAWSF